MQGPATDGSFSSLLYVSELSIDDDACIVIPHVHARDELSKHVECVSLASYVSGLGDLSKVRLPVEIDLPIYETTHD